MLTVKRLPPATVLPDRGENSPVQNLTGNHPTYAIVDETGHVYIGPTGQYEVYPRRYVAKHQCDYLNQRNAQ